MAKFDWGGFLRPTLVVTLCYLVALFVTWLISQRDMSRLDRDISQVAQLAAEVGELQLPDASFTPRQVVRLQTSALADKDQHAGAIRCMCFASPDNLKVTGPLSTFARMIRGPRFEALSSPDAVVLGDAVYAGDKARVLVTAIASDKINAYVWVLAKQTKGRYKGCWMTDGVFPMDGETNAGTAAEPGGASPSQRDNEA